MANLVNREAVQKLCAASYLDDYLDCMQNLPNQLQPHLSRIRELDVEVERLVKQIEHLRSQLEHGKGVSAGGRAGSTDSDNKEASEDSLDGKLLSKKDKRKDYVRHSLESAMEDLGDIVQQKLAATQRMSEIVECRRRLLDDENCDQTDSSFFSPSSRSRLAATDRQMGRRAASPPRGSFASTSNISSAYCKEGNESDHSSGSGGVRRPGDDWDLSSSRSTGQSSPESEVDEKADDAKDSDDTAPDRGSDSAGRRKLGRPPRSRVEVVNTRKAKLSERGKVGLVSRRTKFQDRRTRNQERHVRSVRQAGRGIEAGVTRRQKQDSVSETQSTYGATKANSSRVGAAGQKVSSQRGARGANGGSSTASFAMDITESFDQEVDEQLYCLCKQVSYGEMVGCDNNHCPMQWFHFSCVSLTTKPKGRWFCPSCRGDKPNVRRADLK